MLISIPPLFRELSAVVKIFNAHSLSTEPHFKNRRFIGYLCSLINSGLSHVMVSIKRCLKNLKAKNKNIFYDFNVSKKKCPFIIQMCLFTQMFHWLFPVKLLLEPGNTEQPSKHYKMGICKDMSKKKEKKKHWLVKKTQLSPSGRIFLFPFPICMLQWLVCVLLFFSFWDACQ